MGRWTSQQVLGHAPDERVAKAARALARPAPWSGLGSTTALVWGQCQGSGSTPYQVSVDLTGPAFRCSCPSRKQPCKHAVALLLLWVEGDGSVADVADAPESVAAWVAARSLRGSGEPKPAKPVDPEAQAKRLAERRALMSAGMADFERWLTDLVRTGLAEARHRPYAFWDDAAARLVDAQMPGLAERVRLLPADFLGTEDWAERVLTEIGRWYLAVRAWGRWDELDESTRGDLRVVLGWPMPGAEVFAGTRVRDRWFVAGVHRNLDEGLQSQRTWLWGQAHQDYVVVLDFAAGGAALAAPPRVGSVLAAEVALYPGSTPRRARFVEPPEADDAGDESWGRCLTVAQALEQRSAALARNPWVARVPVRLDGVAVGQAKDGSGVIGDATGWLPIAEDSDDTELLALTGGHPTSVFGELGARHLRPLMVMDETGLTRSIA